MSDPARFPAATPAHFRLTPQTSAASQAAAVDAELAAALRRGDERAFDRFLEARWAALVAYVATRLGDVESAKDIAQEAFVRLWERRRDIDPRRSVVAYLYQVARHRMIDELRRRRVRDRWADQERSAGPRATPADAPLRRLAERELLVALEQAIARLPGRRREAFTLVHVQDLSYRQAAEVMGTAPQTVANQVAAALTQLRRELGDLIGPSPVDIL